MSKRKGMSMDEKGAKLLEIFHEAGEVFQLKDIEKLGVKKGVNGQSIKDVVQALINEDLLHIEKIGSSNFYWSFPAEQSTKLVTQVQQAERQAEGLRQKRAKSQQEVERLKAGQEDMELRLSVAGRLAALKQEVSELEATVNRYRDQDPETVKAVCQGTEVAKIAANRWLDNTHLLASWCKKKFPNMEDALAGLYKEHGYDENMDYI